MFKVNLNLKVYLLLFMIFSFGNSYAQNPPNANYDVATANYETLLSVPSGAPDNYTNLLDNDSDPDGDTITIVRFSSDNGATWIAAGIPHTIPGVGIVTINSDGTYTFMPANGYTGYVPGPGEVIHYEITDGDIDTSNSISSLYITVETNGSILEISGISSCNQGLTSDGKYKIQYTVSFENTSTTRGYHTFSEISNIQLVDDLEAIFGNSCIYQIDRVNLHANTPSDFIGGAYPNDWSINSFDENEFDETDATPGAEGILVNSVEKLYPRQRVTIIFCLYVEPFCGGRPNPTNSGDGIDFDNVFTISSNRGNHILDLLLEDFHTPATTVAANFYIPVNNPTVEFDGSYYFSNTVIITNDGNAQANNVNYNMGLSSFIDNGLNFIPGDHDNNTATPDVQTPRVIQVDATGVPISTVAVNLSFNGDSNTNLLDTNQSLPSGETIYLKVFHHLGPISSSGNLSYANINPSMTLGILDGYDETTAVNKRMNSYVLWDTAQGSHSDRYYLGNNIADIPSSNDQCDCLSTNMNFDFSVSLSSTKSITSQNPAPDAIIEHKEVEFTIRAQNNTSSNVRIENLQLVDNLLGMCGGNILEISSIVINSPTSPVDVIPETLPNLNLTFNGITDTNLFDGISGILNPQEYFDVIITVIIADDCFGTNNVSFIGDDPIGDVVSAGSNTPVSIFTDSDGDSVTNINDIDDDNDGIPDILECNGLNPIADDDSDFIPNYKDLDYGLDINNDSIIDIFDFDMDGVPNHFDLDADGDGIFDIVEAGNGIKDTNNDGRTNFTSVGVNGLDNSLENSDTGGTSVNYVILNSDTDTKFNFLDIDSDGDGIVDNIEAQTTGAYLSPNFTVNIDGIDTAYPNGLTPIDTDNTVTTPDGTPDYIDLDSDDDFRIDSIEAWDTNNDGVADTLPFNNDTDNDGLDNAYDNDDTQINPTNGQISTSFPNIDNTITNERDWRELPAIVVIVNQADSTDSTIEGGNLVYKLQLVTLSNTAIVRASVVDTTININTSDGTVATAIYDVATSPFDYTEIPNTPTTITIPTGSTEIMVTINTLEDTINELDELLTLNCLIISSNTIDLNASPLTGHFEANVELKVIGTIQDNDIAPDLIMNADIQDEGIDLAHTIEIDNFTNTNLTTSSSRPIVIDIVTSNGTAISPDDYTNSNQIVTIDGTIDPANENTNISFTITTIIDDLNEPLYEYLHVEGTVTSANINSTDINKLDTIIDIDPDPTVRISSPTVIEGKALEFMVELDKRNYQDIDMNIYYNDGTARSTEDYLVAMPTLSIPAYEINKKITVTTIDDLLIEDIENFTLTGNIISANTINTDIEGIGTIIDNDFPNLFSPNNDGLSDTFEMISLMQYLKFEVQIFDRWGNQVFNYSNKGNPNPTWWDGTIKGNPVPEGVYYYTAVYNDQLTPAKSGFVQLIR